MSLRSFLWKSTKIVAKFAVDAASAMVRQGPLMANKIYLEKLEKAENLNLNSDQKRLIKEAKILNQKVLSKKRDLENTNKKIKEEGKEEDISLLEEHQSRLQEEIAIMEPEIILKIKEIKEFIEPLLKEKMDIDTKDNG